MNIRSGRDRVSKRLYFLVEHKVFKDGNKMKSWVGEEVEKKHQKLLKIYLGSVCPARLSLGWKKALKLVTPSLVHLMK